MYGGQPGYLTFINLCFNCLRYAQTGQSMHKLTQICVRCFKYAQSEQRKNALAAKSRHLQINVCTSWTLNVLAGQSMHKLNKESMHCLPKVCSSYTSCALAGQSLHLKSITHVIENSTWVTFGSFVKLKVCWNLSIRLVPFAIIAK